MKAFILGKNKNLNTKISANDVAKYILHEMGTMTTWKLQKLLYYCQAWSLVWDDKPLFYEEIQAWTNGPVIGKIYNIHRGYYLVGSWPLGDMKKLSREEKDTIDAVLKHYGHKTSQWLSDLTHVEKPWRNARRGIDSEERGSQPISLDDMYNYYSSL